MKNKTCAGYVCAFLLLVICVLTFVLSEDFSEAESTDTLVLTEHTLTTVDEEKDKGVKLADIPRADAGEYDVLGDSETQKLDSGVEASFGIEVDTGISSKEKETVTSLLADGDAENTGSEFLNGSNTSELPDVAFEEKLVSEIYETAEVKSSGGAITLSYRQPEIPPEYHLTVKAEVYDKNGATYCRYVSDAGWLTESSNYDATEKTVLAEMGAGDLKDKMFILVVKVGDANLSVGATVWQLTQNYDGSRDLIKTYVR